MLTVKKALSSSIGRKYLMAMSGLALVGFIILHLAGNLALYSPDATIFNAYAAKMKAMGPLFYVAEIGLFGLFLFHILLAINLKISHKSARPEKYAVSQTDKGRGNVSSKNMIITGGILAAFLIFHVIDFRFGPGMEEGYTTTIDGEQVRDLYRLVVEEFKELPHVIIYTLTMLFLGFHVRHGFWSAFQSLGAMNPRYEKPVYALGLLIAITASAGFLFIPVYIYFFA